MVRFSALTALLVGGLLMAGAGCASSRAIRARIDRIQQEHGVTVRADNPRSRCYLFGNLPGLLERIDRDLDRLPAHFKENMGPVLIEESFADNPAAWPFPVLVRGYVDPSEAEAGFPIHLKNRSALEKVILFAPRDGELFLHEATHSFEFTIYTHDRERWRAFRADFRGEGGDAYLPGLAGPVVYATAVTLMPPVGYLRVRGMPSLYGWLNHFEDVAETHCYLVRHGKDVEPLKQDDPVLYRKARAVARFTAGP